MSQTPKAAILIPAFRVDPWSDAFAHRFRAAMSELSAMGLSPAIAWVDDGTSDPARTLAAHERVFPKLGAPWVATRHRVNLGQGAALQTALDLARTTWPGLEVFFTFDSDGQHDPADLAPMAKALREGGLHMIFGNRFHAQSKIPGLRRVVLKLASVFERLTTGIAVGDAHNGLRAFDRRTAEVFKLEQNRMAHATEIKLLVARHQLSYGEVPVRITYSEETMRAGQGNLNAMNILRELVEAWWFR